MRYSNCCKDVRLSSGFWYRGDIAVIFPWSMYSNNRIRNSQTHRRLNVANEGEERSSLQGLTGLAVKTIDIEI